MISFCYTEKLYGCLGLQQETVNRVQILLQPDQKYKYNRKKISVERVQNELGEGAKKTEKTNKC